MKIESDIIAIARADIETDQKRETDMLMRESKLKFSRISSDYPLCEDGKNNFAMFLTEDGVGCSCPDMKKCTGGSVCVHCLALLRLKTPPQVKVDRSIEEYLIAEKDWEVADGMLVPPTMPEIARIEADKPAPGVKKMTPKFPETKDEVIHYVCPKCGEEVDIEESKLMDWKLNHMDGCKVNSSEIPNSSNPPHEDVVAKNAPTETAPNPGIDVVRPETVVPNGVTTVMNMPAMVHTIKHRSVIKGISPRLQEIGRIAVGEKGSKSKSGKTRLPTKLDNFIFTTLDKDDEDRYIRDHAMMEMFGDHCTEIPIRLLYNDIELNFPTFYAKYARSGIKLRGDGESWTVYGTDGKREEVYDPNNERGFLDDKDVKPHGILTMLVEGQNSVGGVFKFRTTSWNSINNILSSLSLIKNMCGMLTYIPLKLVYRKKEVTPIGMGRKTWIPVVSVEFRGSIEELQSKAEEVRNYTTPHQREEMQEIEDAVREQLAVGETVDEQRDVADEFAPGVD